MNLKELINLYQGRVDNEYEPGVIRGLLAEVLEDLNNLDEPTKVEIPLFAEDVIKVGKAANLSLFWAMDGKGKTESFCDWIEKPENQETFARAWNEGYEVAEEKRYQVRLKGLDKDLEYLNFKHGHVWVFSDNIENEEYRTKHTRKELEEGGFGEVFNSPLFEIEEVK